MSTHVSSDEYITYSAISILSDDRRCFSFFLSFLLSPRRVMKQDFFSGPVSTIGPKRRFNDKIFFKKQGRLREKRRPCDKMVIDYVRSADRESYWFSVIMDRRRNALPVFHDLKLNILLSAPPTQSFTTFHYMIIGDFKE